MLHTTALALDDREVADLARQHFADYAEAVTLLHNIDTGGRDPVPEGGGLAGAGGRAAGDQPDDRGGVALAVGSGARAEEVPVAPEPLARCPFRLMGASP